LKKEGQKDFKCGTKISLTTLYELMAL